MAQFQYTALSPNGEKVTGVISGFNELDAAARIKESYNVILKLSEVTDKEGGFLAMDIGGNKLNTKAFTVMCNQFAIILKAGIPVARAVKLIAGKTTDKALKKILNKVADDVEGGRSMAASFEDHGKKLLPITFIETLRAGEESGGLDRSFASMATHYDTQAKMASKVKSALAYPLFVLVIAIGVVIVLMVKVVPTFTSIFDELGAELPLVTRILIAISNFFRHYILVMIAIVAVIIIAVKIYGNTEKGRTNLAKLALKIPVLGEINELSAASQYANTMAAMLGAGLPIVKSVGITAKVVENYYISTETGKITGMLEAGTSLGDAMREQAVYPDILVDMTAVGEETGEMEQTLDTIAKYYDQELIEATESAIAKLEPALLVGLAGVAGFIVIAIYMAMFSMYAAM